MQDLYDCANVIDIEVMTELEKGLLICGDISASIFEDLEPDTSKFEINYLVLQVKQNIVWESILKAKEQLEKISNFLWELQKAQGAENNVKNETD